MYPVFNALGTLNFDAMIASYSNITLNGTFVSQNVPIDDSANKCTPCGRKMSSVDAKNCDQPNLLTSALFFPNDDSKFSQLYNFSLHALDLVKNHYDTYISDELHLPALASVFETMGLSFTDTRYASQGYTALNLYADMYKNICTNCTMLTIGKIGKCAACICLCDGDGCFYFYSVYSG